MNPRPAVKNPAPKGGSRMRMLSGLLSLLFLVGGGGGLKAGEERRAAKAPSLSFPALFQTDFEGENVGFLPAGWQVVQGQWQIGKEDGQGVLRQANRLLFDTALATWEWADYAVEVDLRCAAGTGPWAVGLVGYWQDRNHHYRCCLVDDGLHLVRVDGGRITSLTQVRGRFSRTTWYRMRFALQTTPQFVALRGEVQPVDGKQSPIVLEVRDAQPQRVQRGRVGLWTGHAEGAFRNLAVTSLNPPTQWYEETFQSTPKGHPPAHWVTWGGHWISDLVEGQRAYRQMRDETDLTFDDNALAVLEWRDYQFRVRLKAQPQGDTWGLGAVIYYQDVQNHYRLRFLREQLRLFKRWRGEDQELAAVPFVLEPDRWYHLRFQAQETPEGLALQGKVWTGGMEPPSWTIRAEDSNCPLPGGALGFLTFLTAASFDDLKLLYNQPRLP